MGRFENYNPAVTTAYFCAVIGVAMFTMNPLIILLSIMGGLLIFVIYSDKNSLSSSAFYLALFLVMVAINPFVSHNGATVLFVFNNNPVTLEAFIYGVFSALAIVGVLLWFNVFTKMMTRDKLLYVFGFLSPKLALVLSMALRFIPLFREQIKKISQAQKCLGIYKDNNIIDAVKGKLRVFSVMITWVLENGIITADSMTARGYGTGKRSCYSNFKFRAKDLFFLVLITLLTALTFISVAKGKVQYYPEFSIQQADFVCLVGYVAYGVLVLIPTVIQTKEVLKWKFLKWKI